MDLDMRLKFNDKDVIFLCKYVKNKHIEVCPNCIFNKYLCYGLLCNIVDINNIDLIKLDIIYNIQ